MEVTGLEVACYARQPPHIVTAVEEGDEYRFSVLGVAYDLTYANDLGNLLF